MPKILNLINFIKNLGKNRPSPSDVFTIVDDIPVVNTEIINKMLTQKIKPCFIEKIHELQKASYRYDELYEKNSECGICYGTEVIFAQLQCGHEICTECYDELLNKSYKICPICKIELKIIKLNKLYAIISKIDHGIGVLYLPPMYRKSVDLWIENEICIDSESIDTTIQNINDEKYAIVLNSPEVNDIISPYFPNDFIEMYKLV